MKYLLIPLLFLGIVVLSLAYQWPKREEPQVQSFELSSVRIGSTTVVVEVADTPAKRVQGLSGRTGIGAQNGMLFIFEQDGNWGFWMKDMSFPLDMVWLGSDKKIITIARNVGPETYPNAFYPARPARFVLEVPAGFAEAHNLVEGMSAQF